MTLPEMIRKYEKVKDDLGQQVLTYPPDHLSVQIETIGCIIDDLKSIEDQQPSWVTVRAKIMNKIDSELKLDHYENVLKLSQTLHMLPE